MPTVIPKRGTGCRIEKRSLLLLTKEPRMCIIQSKMIFLNEESHELKIVFTKGKDDGN